MELEQMSSAELISLVRRQEQEILDVHRKLAAEELNARQGWTRYEEANRDRNWLRADMVAVPLVTGEQLAQAFPVARESNSTEFDGIKPLPTTPAEALKEMSDLFYVNVECSRAEHVVGIVEAAIQQGGGELPQDERVLQQVTEALQHAMRICDAVPTRLHLSADETQAHIGRLVNAQDDGFHGYAVIRDALVAVNALAQRAASVPAMKQTDLSKQLRDLVGAEPGAKQLVILPKTVLAAADEIDRYYTGMVNWKASAEAKDIASVPAQASTKDGSDSIALCISDLQNSMVFDPPREQRECIKAVTARLFAIMDAAAQQPDIGRDAALEDLTAYGFAGDALGFDFRPMANGEYLRKRDVAEYLATQAAPTLRVQEPLMLRFERWAKSHGGLSLESRSSMGNEKLPFPATYWKYETEIAWRAFANSPVTQAAPEVASVPDAAPQWRKRGTCQWHDGHPDNDDDGGPYETRTLYTRLQPAPAVLSDEQVRDIRLAAATCEAFEIGTCGATLRAVLAAASK